MKFVLSTLNAKYIHTSLALRWLYVANKDKFNVSYIEFVIKENINSVAQQLIETDCDVLGLSVSIWNVRQTQTLIQLLKEKKPELIIFVGGPEVTYEPEFFLENWEIDYVISGEGEFVSGQLFEALQQGIREVDIPGVSYIGHISRTIVQADIEKLILLDSPYQLEEDKEALINRVVYLETSRGCPYQCQYCLSSLEKGVRYFPKEYIYDNLSYLIQSDAKLIKFLDRTFNLNKTHTYNVFNFLIENYRPNLSCQFEIYADLLDDEKIAFLNNNLPKDYFRFEIGIQSTYEPTNLEVKRRQDFDLLSKNIKLLMEGGKIDLHLDLIAGLPFETYERFKKSFNDVFALGAKEVQLGFLKMLRGTNLRRNAAKYGYKYDELPPYEIEYNDSISAEEITLIHNAEEALDRYWNSGRFDRSLTFVFENFYPNRYFEFFEELYNFYSAKNFPRFGYQLEDLFAVLQEFLTTKGIDIFPLLRDDYYDNYTLRPHGFWQDKMSKKEKKQLVQKIIHDESFLTQNKLTAQQIEKYSTIDVIDEQTLLLTLFHVRENKKTPHPRIKYILNS
ncbi:B12-binding domain-containing radical SAM protein [Bacteroides coprosuis]|uniref:B12-binding domain-containing radical SAM protein n=1 Tax=Bacteroides coprosuis TaxID=151276 RepID=UPI001DE1F6E9|nr:radical SAM protein [Bacteroides coprosuis]HJD92864.1 B12-binding domain-containing radical SAM protein [Bacteroides coprosuis]